MSLSSEIPFSIRFNGEELLRQSCNDELTDFEYAGTGVRILYIYEDEPAWAGLVQVADNLILRSDTHNNWLDCVEDLNDRRDRYMNSRANWFTRAEYKVLTFFEWLFKT